MYIFNIVEFHQWDAGDLYTGWSELMSICIDNADRPIWLGYTCTPPVIPQ